MRGLPALLFLLLAFAPAIPAALTGCSSAGTVDDDETEYDRKVRRNLLGEARLRFYDSRFKADRPEMDEWITAFRSPELSKKMRREIVDTCRKYGSLIGANLAYMAARAGIDEVIPYVREALTDDDRYVRQRAIRSIAPGWAPQFKADLLPLTGNAEPADEVRAEARELYRYALGPQDFDELYAQLGTPAADDEGTRQFVTTCLTWLLREMPADDRDARVATMAQSLGKGSAWQDEFAFGLLQGKFPPEALPALVRVYADAKRNATVRRDMLVEVWRQVTQGGATLPEDQLRAVRAALVADLTSGRFDPDQIADLLRAAGLDDAMTTRLTAWLLEQPLAGDSPSLGGVVAYRLVADELVPNAANAAKVIESVQNPGLQELAMRTLLRFAASTDASLPRDGIIQAIASGLRSEHASVRNEAANSLATLEDEIALDYLVDALRGNSEEAATAAADVMVRKVAVERLADMEIDLCDVIRLEGPRALPTYNVAAGLRVLEVCGGQFTLDFMNQYCKPERATVDVAVVIDRVRKTIERRVKGE
ncbi:MAG: hypothetical protein AB7K09_13485 [Planctomycetota bacterium]